MSTCRASLLSRGKEVPAMSGLNWGLANGHVVIGDAYIGITVDMAVHYPELFPPKADIATDTGGKSSSRQNNHIEMIWDDGTRMKGLLEGNLDVGGVIYPNKLASFPQKNILGKYLRNRLGVDLYHRITRNDLEKYGRTYIGISKDENGIYHLDFSNTSK